MGLRCGDDGGRLGEREGGQGTQRGEVPPPQAGAASDDEVAASRLGQGEVEHFFELPHTNGDEHQSAPSWTSVVTVPAPTPPSESLGTETDRT